MGLYGGGKGAQQLDDLDHDATPRVASVLNCFAKKAQDNAAADWLVLRTPRFCTS